MNFRETFSKGFKIIMKEQNPSKHINYYITFLNGEKLILVCEGENFSELNIFVLLIIDYQEVLDSLAIFNLQNLFTFIFR